MSLPPPTVVYGSSPFLISLPHSGQHYPEDLQKASCLSPLVLRRSEDAFLDQLFAWAPARDISMIIAQTARAYVDVNRDPKERDPVLEGIPLRHRRCSERAAAGLGVVPRIVGAGLNIYTHPLTPDDVDHRIATGHAPYHAQLRAMIAHIQARHGYAIVLDCHSMPSVRIHGRPIANIVLGDRFGQSCAPVVRDSVHAACEAHALSVSLNQPYAGGYTTERYGRPHEHCHVLQIEIDRGLYMDEITIEKKPEFENLYNSFWVIFKSVFEHISQAMPPAKPRLAAE